MKFKITIECEDEFERQAVLDCVKNKLLLEGIYSEVFRPVIKYGQDENKVASYEMVWEELSEYLGSRDE